MNDAPASPRFDTRIAVVVALLALLVRVGYELHLHSDDGPVGRMGTVIMGDERAYDALARNFANDDFARERAFYQEPMYAWLVSWAYAVAPPPELSEDDQSVIELAGVHTFIYWTQHLLGVLTAVLVAALGVRAGGARVGLIAGLLAAVSGPLVFHEAMLLKSSAGLFVFTATLLLWTTTWKRGGRARAAALGALTGLGILLRGNMYLLLPLVCVSLALRKDARGRGQALIDGIICGLAALLPLVPVTLHNLALGDRVLTTYQSGTNAIIGMPESDDVRAAIAYMPLIAGRGDALYEEADAVQLAEQLAGRTLASHEVSATWWSEWRRRVGARPGVAALRAFAKAASTFHGDEIPDVKDWQFFRRTVAWLGTPLSDFHFVGPLALVGALLALLSRRPGRRARLIVLAGLGVVVITLALFYVMGRYRLSAAPCLWILAAFAIDEGWTRFRSGKRLVPIVVGVLVAIFGTVTWLGHWTIRPDIRGANSFQTSWVNDASVSLQRAKLSSNPTEAREYRDLAVAAARQSLELAPTYPDAHQKVVRAYDLSTTVLEPLTDEAHRAAWRLLLALEQQRTGQPQTNAATASPSTVRREAARLRRLPSREGSEAYVSKPLADTALRLAQDLRRDGAFEEALELVDVSLKRAPGVIEAFVERGLILKKIGRPTEALSAYQRALDAGIDTPELHNNLGNLLLQLARPAEALPHFERAAALMPGNATIERNIQRAREALEQ